MIDKKPYIVGITGGSASGKTLFLKRLMTDFKETEICLISQDNYYLPRHEQPVDENGVSNFDLPESIDFEAYARDISKLREGETVTRQEYVFNNPNSIPAQLEFKPSPVIVVEGIFVLYFSIISDLLDLKIFIEAKDHIKLKRRIIRDKMERGYDLDDVLYRYEKHVIPTYEKYIAPYKHNSDVIIPNNSNFNTALDVMVTFLKSRVNDD